MPMYDYAIKAAFANAKRDNYQAPRPGVDPDTVADECSSLIEVISDLSDPNMFESDEEFRIHVMREAFVRAFEAGLAVGLEAGEEEIEVRVNLDRETIAGLVQQALAGNNSLKE